MLAWIAEGDCCRRLQTTYDSCYDPGEVACPKRGFIDQKLAGAEIQKKVTPAADLLWVGGALTRDLLIEDWPVPVFKRLGAKSICLSQARDFLDFSVSPAGSCGNANPSRRPLIRSSLAAVSPEISQTRVIRTRPDILLRARH